MKEHVFSQSSGIEKQYRLEVLPALSKLVPIKDVGDNPLYFDKGIDFIHKSEFTDTTSDAKIDAYATGNLCYELYSSDRTGGSTLRLNPGWGLKSESALILYVFSLTAEVIVFELNKARPWLEQNWEKFPTVSVYNQLPREKSGYLAWNSLVPIEAFLKAKEVQAKVFDLERMLNIKPGNPLATKLAKRAKVAFAPAEEFSRIFEQAPTFSKPSTYDWDSRFLDIVKKDKFRSKREDLTLPWLTKLNAVELSTD